MLNVDLYQFPVGKAAIQRLLCIDKQVSNYALIVIIFGNNFVVCYSALIPFLLIGCQRYIL
jgi:hypothetical protein